MYLLACDVVCWLASNVFLSVSIVCLLLRIVLLRYADNECPFDAYDDDDEDDCGEDGVGGELMPALATLSRAITMETATSDEGSVSF